MKRLAFCGVVALAGLLVGANPAMAIINGEPDGDRHPYVGVSIITDRGPEYPGGFGSWIGCSGTLIAPSVVLTTGSCVVLMQEWLTIGWIEEPLWVTFDATFSTWPKCGLDGAGEVTCPGAVKVAQMIAHPDLNANGWNNGASGRPEDTDLGVYLLETPINDTAPATLPPLGYLDALHAQNGLQDQTFGVVGYGLARYWTDPGPSPSFRRIAVSEFLALAPGELVVSQNAATDDGGACRWDWGGPVLHGDPEVAVAVITGGDRACRALGLHIRVDTESAHQFLGQYVTLP